MRILGLALCVALLMSAGAAPAAAHAKMVASVPKAGATVAAGVSEIALKFSHPMRLTLLRVHRKEEDRDIPLHGSLPKAFAAAATVAVDALTAGTYDVSWTAVSDDGHVMKGDFGFKVSDTPPAKPAQ